MKKKLTIPVVFSLGFFMIMATSLFTSLTNCSATPDCVCSIVTQIWMLKDNNKRATNNDLRNNFSDQCLKLMHGCLHISLHNLHIPHCTLFFWPYLDGNCRVLRFQPFEVSALDKRKISKTSEPSATTDTSGSPNTNIPSIWRILWEESVFSTCLCTVPFLASKCYLAMQMYICHSLYTFKAIPCPCLSCVI